jgi:hypothetical protein
MLKTNGEDVKVVQELLRHASARITLDVYAQAVTPDKRRAQSKVAEMLRAEKGMKEKSLLDPSGPLAISEEDVCGWKYGRHERIRTADLYRINPLTTWQYRYLAAI